MSSSSTQKIYVTECCNRSICPRCLSINPRLASYNPCLSCLGGVGVVSSAHESNRKALKVGGVDAADVFVLEDSDDDDDEGGGDRVQTTDNDQPDAPPPYSAAAEPVDGTSRKPVTSESKPLSLGGSAPDITSESAAQDPAPDRFTRNSEYWIKPGDTLVGIALKYGVDGRLLCKMNALPPSTLSITPHLLHTRITLVLPPTARRPPSPPPADMQERLEARAKEKAAKRLQFVTKEVDHRVARAYVSLAEGEASVDNFEDDKKNVRPGGRVGDDNLQDRAIDRYLGDEEWEAEQRRQGLKPSIQGFPYLSPVGRASSSEEKSRSQQWSWWKR